MTLGSQWLRQHGNCALTFVFLWAPYMVLYFNLIFVALMFFPPSSLHSPFKIEQKNTEVAWNKTGKKFQDARVAPIADFFWSCWWALMLWRAQL